MNNMQIRRAQLQDAEAIHIAHMKSIREVCSKDHTPEEIQAWGDRPYREDQRAGFNDNGPLTTVEINGQKIRCYPMNMKVI